MTLLPRMPSSMLKSHAEVKLINLVLSFVHFPILLFLLYLYSNKPTNFIVKHNDFWFSLQNIPGTTFSMHFRAWKNLAQVLFWAKISSAMKSYLMVLQCVIKVTSLLWLNCHKTKPISLSSLRGPTWSTTSKNDSNSLTSRIYAVSHIYVNVPKGMSTSQSSKSSVNLNWLLRKVLPFYPLNCTDAIS